MANPVIFFFYLSVLFYSYIVLSPLSLSFSLPIFGFIFPEKTRFYILWVFAGLLLFCCGYCVFYIAIDGAAQTIINTAVLSHELCEQVAGELGQRSLDPAALKVDQKLVNSVTPHSPEESSSRNLFSALADKISGYVTEQVDNRKCTW